PDSITITASIAACIGCWCVAIVPAERLCEKFHSGTARLCFGSVGDIGATSVPEPRNTRRVGHFLIEGARDQAGSPEQTFSVGDEARARMVRPAPSHSSPAAGPISRTRAAPDRDSDPRSAALLASGHAAA